MKLKNKKIKKNRRNAAKYPGLDKNVNLKIRADLLDQDYINKLSPEEKPMAL